MKATAIAEEEQSTRVDHTDNFQQSKEKINTEGDYERDYQETLPQGRTAAEGCKVPATAVAIGSGSAALGSGLKDVCFGVARY